MQKITPFLWCSNPDRAKAKRATDAMLKRVELDIAALQAAYAGNA